MTIGFVIGGCAVLYVVGKILRMRAQVRQMHEEIEWNTRRADVPEEVSRQVRELVAQNRNLEAMRKFREGTGLGVVESKEYVDLVRMNLEERMPHR